MKKRFLSVFLALVITVGMLPVSAFAISNSGKCGDNANWFYNNNGVLTISGVGDMKDYDNESNVAPWLKYYREDIKEVQIEEGITSIGSYGLYGCVALEKIHIPSSVTSIGSFAFSHCDSITEFNIPSTVKSLGASTFYGCDRLSAVDLGKGITKIEPYTFAVCGSIRKMVIPSNVTDIGDYAFDYCTALEELDIPSSVSHIGYRVFYDCKSLKTLFYGGTEEEWSGVRLEKENFPIEKVQFYGNSKTTGKAGNSEISIKVLVNGKSLVSDQPPVIVEGRTLVPLRAIFEALGASVEWNDEEKAVSGSKGSDEIYIKIGEKRLVKNGKGIGLDVPAQIINGRTMVPARAVSEAYSCKVDWDNATKTVSITG